MTKPQERLERFILICTLLYIHTVPLGFYIWPEKSVYSKITSILSTICGILSILYVALCLCYRGFIRFKKETPDTIISVPYPCCHICMQYKPERAHHCSKCKKCIKKMDHHCHWLGRCINYDNHGHFIRFLLFTFISTALIFSFTVYYIIMIIRKDELAFDFRTGLVIVASTIIAGGLGIIMFAHLRYQILMAMHNITYMEMLRKKCYNFNSMTDYTSQYDVGVYRNITQVFGPAKYLFLWKPSGNGMCFRTKDYEGDEMPSCMYDNTLDGEEILEI